MRLQFLIQGDTAMDINRFIVLLATNVINQIRVEHPHFNEATIRIDCRLDPLPETLRLNVDYQYFILESNTLGQFTAVDRTLTIPVSKFQYDWIYYNTTPNTRIRLVQILGRKPVCYKTLYSTDGSTHLDGPVIDSNGFLTQTG